MNSRDPFITNQARNARRPWAWMQRDSRGNFNRISGWFASREAAEKWMRRQTVEGAQ